MKKIFHILFFLLTSIGYSQQIVELCEEKQTTFIYSSSAGITGNYVWNVNGINFNENPLVYTWNTPGFYEIKLVFTSLSDCKDSVYYNVSVIECQETKMWFPNSFTPNGNDDNETWSPKGFNYTELEFIVYNRWGELIFISNTELNPWNGKYKGIDCQQDVYVFVATWRGRDKIFKKQYGHIVLIR